jgi:phage/plasmid-associated DNA primase
LRHYYQLAAQENFVHEMPPDIFKMTEDLRLKANSVGYFLQSCVVDDPSSSVLVKDMYEVYTKWCKLREVKPVKITEFRQQLTLTNYTIERTGQGYICHCVSLKTDAIDTTDPTPTPSLLESSNDDDNADGQDYLDEFPF